MELTVQQIAHLIGGQVQGNPQQRISKFAKIQEGGEGTISFLANPKYESYLYTTQASAVIVSNALQLKEPISTTLILVENPYAAFSTLLEEYYKIVKPRKKGIEQPAHIAASASLGQDVYVGAFAYIGENVQIGDNVQIYPHTYIGDNVKVGNNTTLFAGVKVYPLCVIGNYCTLHAGAVIGSDGFGFAPKEDGTYQDVPQIGNVVLADFVNVGANTTIDCAAIGSTLIEKGVKLDNLIQIAHNAKVGKNTVIAALTGVSGSTSIGENCVIAGQVGMVGHISIANKTTVGAQSGITKNIEQEGQTLLGSPVQDHKEALKTYVVYRNLPELKKRVDELEKQLKNIKQN